MKTFCQDFNVRNRNAEICLENRYDSAKFGMVGISVTACVMVSVSEITECCQTAILTFLLVLQNITACVMVSVS